MPEKIEVFQVDRKYRVVFEQAASTKGAIGFKVESFRVEANGDNMEVVKMEAVDLLEYAKAHAPNIGGQ